MLSLICMLLILPQSLCLSQLLVLSPSSLAQRYPQGIPNQMGTFGQFPYGSFVAGKLAVVSQDGCSPIAPGLSGTIYLIIRGNCYFKNKVRYAQQAGAKAVIIYNHLDEKELVTMYGRPTDITIPSLFISNQNGLVLRQYSNLQLNLTFSISPKLNTAYAVGFSIGSNDTQLAAVVSTALTFNLKVKPVFAITTCFDCTSYGRRLDYCLGGGRYCAYNSDKNGLMLQEAIRQQCIYSLNSSAYLPYLQKWFGECQMAVGGKCQADLASSVQSCFSNSYQRDISLDDNKVLNYLYEDVYKLQPRGLPTLMIGEESYFGELTDAYLSQALCAYTSDTLPSCTKQQCSPGCRSDMLTNGVCDAPCNTSLCGNDNGSCATNCSIGCTDTMRLSGRCYAACNNAKCEYGNGACLCAPGCTPTLLANSVCDFACNTKNCSYDSNLCSECSPGCTSLMLSSGICYDECNTKDCNYGNLNCDCAPECPLDLRSNSVCDSACNFSNCDYDNFLCIECSPGCLGEMLLTNQCYPECDTWNCSYSNWNCRCAEECPMELLANDVCDSVCDNARCRHDNGLCVVFEEVSDDSGSDPAWLKPVIIVISVLGGL